ncbi:MAG TPA: ATP-binding protein, partial [Dongiaceae bacterium]|nr:ATP-binding protein [Dongiaceae bacterium]
MFLKKMLYVNWGNIPQLEVDFGPVNLFSGGNGSGKTTAADGIQTLMTAAYENLFNFNPGQDETTQRGRGGKQVRTLASYVLGCDDGSYARLSTTDGYLGAVFAAGSGEKAEPFTILMGMRAHLDSAGNQRQARLDEVLFFILPGLELALDKLVRSYDDGKHVVPVDDIGDLLQREFGKKSLEVYDKKGAYLRRLYGLLRGKRDAVSDREAKHAARTFANFMAYKPVKSINDFVAEEILEKKDLGEAIRTVSDLMKTIHGMEEDARHIRESLGILQQASQTSTHYVEYWVRRALLRYQEASRLFQLKQKNYIDTKQLQKKLQDDIQERDTRLAVNRERRAETHQQIVELEAQRRGISVLNEKDQLQASIDKLQNALSAKAVPLLQQDQQLQRNVDSSKQIAASLQQQSWGTDIAAFDQKPLRDSLKAILKLEQSHGIDLQRLFNRDWVDIAPLEEYLDRAIELDSVHNQWSDRLHLPMSEQVGSVRDQLAALKNEWERELQSQQRQLQLKEKEIAQLEARKVAYPGGVEVALKAIRAQCPDADPRVLCDYIEVLDPQWQMAIEGYMGGARFSIIVQPECEAEAIRIVRNLPGQRNSARVIQGSKAQRDAERFQPVADSIVHILKFQHKTAEYYVRASYGNVVRVPDAETLRSTARGITSNGLASGNYSMWRCDIPDAELVFGQSARERALVAKRQELETLLAQMQGQQEQVEAVQQLFKAVSGVQSIAFGRTLQEMLDTHRQLKRAEQTLAQLDTTDFERLEAELVQARQRFVELEADLKQLENDKGQKQAELKNASEKAESLDRDKEKLQLDVERQEASVRQIQPWQPERDLDQLLQDADAQLSVDDHNFFREELANIDKTLLHDANHLFTILMQHNQRCNPFDAIVYDPDIAQLHEPTFFKRIS